MVNIKNGKNFESGGVRKKGGGKRIKIKKNRNFEPYSQDIEKNQAFP